MNILYVGDVMAEPGLKLIEELVPKLRLEHNVSLVIAQAENTTEGRGVSVSDFARLKAAGVDFCSGGNWSLWRDDIIPAMSDPLQPIIRPANYPAGTPGLGYKYVSTPEGSVLVISLLGQVVGRDADKPVDNPLQVIDAILEKEFETAKIATVVNFHGDYSSEKVIIGHYLDGRVTAVVGDHWHVPTADAQVLPKGTAHMTDVGMCGSLDSSLGIRFESVIPRWKDNMRTRNELAVDGRRQFNALLVAVDSETSLATSVQHIRHVLPA